MGGGNGFISISYSMCAYGHRCGEESVRYLSFAGLPGFQNKTFKFSQVSLTIHITHVIQAHVAFSDFFTNQVFVTFNEHYFTPGTKTICHTDVRYSSASAAACVWTLKIQKGVILLEEDIFLTPSDHQKAEDVRGVDGRKQLLYQIHWVEM